MELQRDVPQYMAIPWLITWVIARTVSANHNINYQSPDNTQILRDRGTKADVIREYLRDVRWPQYTWLVKNKDGYSSKVMEVEQK